MLVRIFGRVDLHHIFACRWCRTTLWSARILADDPAAIERVHQQYYEAGMYASTILCCRQLCMPGLACMQVAHAGADVATTASYQASFAGFERGGLRAL